MKQQPTIDLSIDLEQQGVEKCLDELEDGRPRSGQLSFPIDPRFVAGFTRCSTALRHGQHVLRARTGSPHQEHPSSGRYVLDVEVLLDFSYDLERQQVGKHLDDLVEGKRRSGQLSFPVDPGSLAGFDRNAKDSLRHGRHDLRTLHATAYPQNPPKPPFVVNVEVESEFFE